MHSFLQGFLATHPGGSAGPNDITVALRNWFVSRNPMLTRLPWIPLKDSLFRTYSRPLVESPDAMPRVAVQCSQKFKFPITAGSEIAPDPLPDGIATPFDFNMAIQLQNMVDAIEQAIYSGDGKDGRMLGLTNYLDTNNTEIQGEPTKEQFLRYTVKASRAGGGEPDCMLLSTDFFERFKEWDAELQRKEAGETVFGTPITIFESGLLPNITIIEAPLLHGTAIALTSCEVYVRNKVNPHWNIRGSEGEWIAEMAIEAINEQHHAVLTIAD